VGEGGEKTVARNERRTVEEQRTVIQTGKHCSRIIFATWCSVLLTASVVLFPLATGASGPAAGDAGSGKVLFEKRCTGCHALDMNKEGPRLRGVFGRRAGSVPDFNYSDELRAAKIVWDPVSLDRWLTDPDSVVKDNDMAFHVSNPRERADLIEFLRISSGK
jgi:cytochrome c